MENSDVPGVGASRADTRRPDGDAIRRMQSFFFADIYVTILSSPGVTCSR